MSTAEALADPAPAPTPAPAPAPVPHPATEPKVEHRPLLMVYRDAQSKPYVLIAGNGHGSWLLPKMDEIPREELDSQQHSVTPKNSFNVIDFGQNKPTINVKNHAVFSWVSLDLAKTILGDQFEHLIPKDIQQEIAGAAASTAAPPAPAIAPITELPAPAAPHSHADTCNGCDNCKTHAEQPKSAALATTVEHQGVSEPTASMLAMHGDKTTHIGAIR